jgi:hypothetical protein
MPLRSYLLAPVVLAAVAAAAAAQTGGGAAAVPKPDIVTRDAWGSTPDPIPAARRHTPRYVTIHHAGVLWTNSQEPEQFLRNMQAWGKLRPEIEQPPRNTYWPDLAYHFLIAPDGRIFEGRPLEYEPESNTKYDLAGNINVEMMGDFNRQRPSPAQLESCARLTAWLMQELHIAVAEVRTHRDAAPGQTECPGADFYRYFEDGQFRKWLAAISRGEDPHIDPGPPLGVQPNGQASGPTEVITETRPTE